MQLHLVADLVAADHVEQRLQRHSLGVQQQFLHGLARSDRKHAQVAEHLALAREERREATLAGAHVGELLGDLAVEEPDGARAGQSELAAFGAVEQTARGAQRLVLGSQAVCVGRGHGTSEHSPADR